ncbi:MAG: hypothetical protein H6708_16670 [Kofleriaceae bacterium]|nr:hypothetical protein [Myxococcales bacterium]MCB9562038.1 hypothetical protein [Kofleriaceae bacterium]
MTPDLAALTADHFRPLLDQDFTLAIDGAAPCAARLVEVTEGAPLHPSLPRAPFSLILQTTAPPVPWQGPVVLAHPAIGELAIVVTAVAPGPTGQRYQAVFA